MRILWPDSESPAKTGLDTGWTIQIGEGHLICSPGATTVILVIVGATGTIKDFRDQIQNPLWKPV